MSQFILDTDVLTLIQKGHPEICGRFLEQPPDTVAITVLSVEVLEHGATLVNENTRDFKQIPGLKIVSWSDK